MLAPLKGSRTGFICELRSHYWRSTAVGKSILQAKKIAWYFDRIQQSSSYILPIISVLNDVAQRLVDSIYAVIDATEKFRKKFNLLLKKHSFCGKIRKKQPLVDKMKSKVGGVETAVACIIEPQG